jgi:poly-gamma-glutamate synthesis protein (capsule biosynthesis protein)
MANLECAVSLRGAPVPKAFRFRGRPSSLRAAAGAGGLDVVNLANNHAGDYGGLAFIDTIRWSRRYGLAVAGAGFSQAGALRPAIVERLGLRIAVVGFGNILPSEFAAGPRRPGTAWATAANVRTAVGAARRQADVVIATFHWGIERARTENAEQRSLARLALASGATAVVGAHPHVLQPIRRAGPRRLVAYSLGNFVFGAHSPGTADSGILELELSARGVERFRFPRARIVAGRPVLR